MGEGKENKHVGLKCSCVIYSGKSMYWNDRILVMVQRERILNIKVGKVFITRKELRDPGPDLYNNNSSMLSE